MISTKGQLKCTRPTRFCKISRFYNFLTQHKSTEMNGSFFFQPLTSKSMFFSLNPTARWDFFKLKSQFLLLRAKCNFFDHKSHKWSTFMRPLWVSGPPSTIASVCQSFLINTSMKTFKRQLLFCLNPVLSRIWLVRYQQTFKKSS